MYAEQDSQENAKILKGSKKNVMATSACEPSFPFSPSVWSLPVGKCLAFQSRFCNAIQWERRDIYSDTAGTFWLLIHVKEKAMHLFIRVCIFECAYQACMHANTHVLEFFVYLAADWSIQCINS